MTSKRRAPGTPFMFYGLPRFRSSHSQIPPAETAVPAPAAQATVATCLRLSPSEGAFSSPVGFGRVSPAVGKVGSVPTVGGSVSPAVGREGRVPSIEGGGTVGGAVAPVEGGTVGGSVGTPAVVGGVCSGFP